jgi:hypothetical protein
MLYLSYELIVSVLKLCEKEYVTKLINSSKLLFTLRGLIQIQIIFHKWDEYTYLNMRMKLRIKHNKYENIKHTDTHITYDTKFNSYVDNISQSVTHIRFGSSHNTNFNLTASQIKFIKFGNNFNINVDNLPITLIYLIFTDSFNQTVDDLPESLLHLRFGYYFNKSVNKLPKKLLTLVLGYYFNKNLYSLPVNLKRIEIGVNFQGSINYLPLSIERMICNNVFLLKNYGYLSKLTHLCVNNIYHLDLPKSLTYLKIIVKHRHEIINQYPNFIKFICFSFRN